MAFNLSFREFLDEEAKTASYFASMKDELGVDPEQFTKGAQVGSFFNMGGTYNLSPFKILSFEYDTTGKPTYARCQIVNHPSFHNRKYRTIGKETVKLNSAEPDDKVYLIPISKLQGMMGQGLEGGGAAAGGGAGGMGGLPPSLGM